MNKNAVIYGQSFMSLSQSNFCVGDRYSITDIQSTLGVGNAGGVRVCLGDSSQVKRMVILTSIPNARQASENPYHDRIEGDVLIYTGAGRAGDQSLAGINKRIPQQIDGIFPIYGFQLIGSRRDVSIGRKRWRFLGLLEYIRHYPETQLDVRQQLRQVWLFEFFVHSEPRLVKPGVDQATIASILAANAVVSREVNDDREVVTLRPESTVDNGRENAVHIEAERSRLLTLPPQEFERVVRDVLLATGFDRVHVTKYSQDGGIDVNAYASRQMWPITNLLIQIQAKRWLHTVGRKEIAELRGSLEPFARGAVVTTSHFSKAAIAEADAVGKNPIVLVDGYSFARTIRALGPVRDGQQTE